MKLYEISKVLRTHTIELKGFAALCISALLTMLASSVCAEENQTCQENKIVSTAEVIELHAMSEVMTSTISENKNTISNVDAISSNELVVKLASN